MKGQPDIIVLNNHRFYNGLCIEFKSPTNNYKIGEEQINIQKQCQRNGYEFIS